MKRELCLLCCIKMKVKNFVTDCMQKCLRWTIHHKEWNIFLCKTMISKLHWKIFYLSCRGNTWKMHFKTKRWTMIRMILNKYQNQNGIKSAFPMFFWKGSLVQIKRDEQNNNKSLCDRLTVLIPTKNRVYMTISLKQ